MTVRLAPTHIAQRFHVHSPFRILVAGIATAWALSLSSGAGAGNCMLLDSTKAADASWIAADGAVFTRFPDYAARQCLLGGWDGLARATQPNYYCALGKLTSAAIPGQPPVSIECPDHYEHPRFDKGLGGYYCQITVANDGICPVRVSGKHEQSIVLSDPDCSGSCEQVK